MIINQLPQRYKAKMCATGVSVKTDNVPGTSLIGTNLEH